MKTVTATPGQTLSKNIPGNFQSNVLAPVGLAVPRSGGRLQVKNSLNDGGYEAGIFGQGFIFCRAEVEGSDVELPGMGAIGN